jgi:uncharacterized protein
MKDRLLRRVIKRIALLRYLIDLNVMRAALRARGQPNFELRGACEGCGKCCENPSMQVNPLIFRLKSLRWLFLTWHWVINGFEYVSEIRQGYVLVFRCHHFDLETRRCDSYDSRPGMCRDYPRALLYQVRPEFFDGCGFYAAQENAEQFRAALDELELPAEKIEELKKKLYLNEKDEEPNDK